MIHWTCKHAKLENHKHSNFKFNSSIFEYVQQKNFTVFTMEILTTVPQKSYVNKPLSNFCRVLYIKAFVKFLNVPSIFLSDSTVISSTVCLWKEKVEMIQPRRSFINRYLMWQEPTVVCKIIIDNY